MRVLLRLVFMAIIVVLGGVVFIHYTYGCSWKESFQIADGFVEDLLGSG
jgi:hypothetical protein